MIPIFRGTIQKGKVVFADADAVDTYVQSIQDGTEVDITIAKKNKRRSTPQNNWYWGGILPVIAKETGHSTEELHEIFKRKFLQRKIVQYRGQNIAMPGSTAQCTTAEFSAYIDRIRAEVAEYGIIIPEADSVTW